LRSLPLVQVVCNLFGRPRPVGVLVQVRLCVNILFCDSADLLQSIVNKAWRAGVLHHPLCDNFQDDFPIIQYADDTLLILPGDNRVLFNLKGLLRSFIDSTGLHVNFSKSSLVPINISPKRVSHLANTFGCQVGQMPFTYLGLPLGTNRPNLNEFPPAVYNGKKTFWC